VCVHNPAAFIRPKPETSNEIQLDAVFERVV